MATWTRSYKQNFSINYAGFCYAEILNKDFLVKNFGVAIFQRKKRQKNLYDRVLGWQEVLFSILAQVGMLLSFRLPLLLAF